MTNQLDMPFLLILPSKVTKCKKISRGAQMHFGVLVGLAVNEGYCWARDETLAGAHEVSTRQIKRWHEVLEANGFIKRECSNINYRTEEGKFLWKRVRKINLNTEEMKYDT